MTSRKRSESDAKKKPDEAEDFHVEELIDRPFSRLLARRLLGYLRPYSSLVLASVVLIVLSTILSLLGPLLVKEAIDGPLSITVLKDGDSGGTGSFVTAMGDRFGLEPIVATSDSQQRTGWLWLIVGMYLSVLVIGFFIQYIQVMVLERTGQNATKDLRLQIFSHLQFQSSSFYHRNPVGRLVTRVTNDVESLNELFASGFVSLAGDLLAIGGIVAMLFWTNAELASMVLMVTPIVVIAMMVFRKYARKHYREMRRRLAPERFHARIHQRHGSCPGMPARRAASEPLFRDQQHPARCTSQ